MKFRNIKTGEIRQCSPTLLNAAKLSAQNRKRLFWVGKLVGDKYEQVPITQPQDKGILLKDILEEGEVDERMTINGKSFSMTASYNGAVEWNSIERRQRTMVRAGQINKGGQKDFVRKLTCVECERLMTLPDNFLKYGINEKGEQVEISNSQKYKLAGNGVVVEVVNGIMKDLLKEMTYP